MTPTITRTAPVFRIFDEALARAHYVDWLGFTWNGDYRSDPEAPLYAFLQLGALHLHLSAHYGDATPGSTAIAHVNDIRSWHACLPHNPRMRPGLAPQPWGLEVATLDPFGNRLIFLQQGEAGRPVTPDVMAPHS